MTIVPDGIDPVVAFRSWSFDGQKLRSAYGNDPWEPGEPFEAKCPSASWEWVAVQDGGMTLEEIKSSQQQQQQYWNPGQRWQAQAASAVSIYHQPPPYLQGFGPSYLPNVTLPEGWGYESRVLTHQPPDEGCSCGLYGAVTMDGVPGNVVWGKVNLWGKVIKGARAHRAQYGYPLELTTRDKDLLEALEAYGVPIEVVERPPTPPDIYGLQQFISTNVLSNSSSSLDQTQFTTLMNYLTATEQVYGQSVTKMEWLEDELTPRLTAASSTAPLTDWWDGVKP